MSLYVNFKKKLRDFEINAELNMKDSKLIYGILGSSGCGKSMTLKCIAGIEEPDSGEIVLGSDTLYNDKLRVNIPARKRKIAYLFQNYALFPHMNVEDNILISVKKIDDKIKSTYENLLNILHIAHLRKSYPKMLSGGESQRVALARIIMSNPNMIILDEPFSAIDEFLKEKLEIELISLLNSLNIPILMVSHSREEVYRCCDYIYVIDKGKIVDKGYTKEVFDKPKTVASAKITGCKNIFNAKVISDNEIYIKKLDIKLNLSMNIPGNIRAVGIRAHYLSPKEERNTVAELECKNPIMLNDMFENIIVFDKDIWWKSSKNEYRYDTIKDIPTKLYINEEALILLE